MTELRECQEETPISTGEEDVRQYLSEIRQYPRLSPEQERELARRCAQGDAEAIREMVNSNLRLVVSIAREYAGKGVPMLDLIQEGSIGLLEAAKRYDYTLDYRFSTYATKWILRGVTTCLVHHDSMIRVPKHTAEKMRRIVAVKHMLHQQNGVEPTEEEIARHCDLPEGKVRQLMQLNPELCSLDAPVGEDDSGKLSGILANVHAVQPYEELVREQLSHTMETLLAGLNDRQRQVVRLYFGMEDGNCYSMEQIGTQLGISKERVRQVKQQAMDKLHKMGASMGLEDFLE